MLLRWLPLTSQQSEDLLQTVVGVRRHQSEERAHEAQTVSMTVSQTYPDVTKVPLEPIDLVDGLSAKDLFSKGQGYTYDDFLLMPRHIDFGTEVVSLKTRVSRNIELTLPFVSSPMDTVTESRMAIAMALQGGLGVIHYNCSIAEQAAMVDAVKRYKNGFITDPKVLSTNATVEDVRRIKGKYGFSGVPITENGAMNGKLVGIVTNRDIDFVADPKTPVTEVMSKDLVVAKDSNTLYECNQILLNCKKAKLPIINENNQLVALMSRTDLLKNQVRS